MRTPLPRLERALSWLMPLLLVGCRGEPVKPQWHEGVVYGPVIGDRGFQSFFGEATPAPPLADVVPQADTAHLTFSFALPRDVATAPLSFDLEDVQTASQCNVDFAQLDRPPKLPAFAVGTLSLRGSSCSGDDETLRPGTYRGRLLVGGQTFDAKTFTVR